MTPHETLLLQIARGDRSAFRELYETFKDKVYNTALSYLQQVPEAEEVTQDIFVEIFDAAKQFSGQSTVSTWIYRIAVNKCLDRLRYHKRKKRFAYLKSLFGDTGELIHDPPDFVHPGVLLDQKEQSKQLFRAIESLADQQKTAFILSYVEELPQKEVAIVMEISVKAVESLIQRAKANLRKELGNYYDTRRK